MAGEGEEDLPRDAKIVKSLLKSMGVEDYEPRVIHQFLELWYRYVVEVLTDAQVYSEHASKSNIDCDDVKLAIQSKVNFSFSQPPPREVYIYMHCCFFCFILLRFLSENTCDMSMTSHFGNCYVKLLGNYQSCHISCITKNLKCLQSVKS